MVEEKETAALLSAMSRYLERVSSALARVEVFRALLRWRATASDLRRAADVLVRVALIRIDEQILERAADLKQPDLRSLDAIHIATALSVEDDLAAIVTYDGRLASGARALRLQVISPG